MSSHSRQSTPSNERVESRRPPEEWQLQILLEQHKKQPRPTVEQRRLLANQTGLDAKWIARWFRRMNSTSKSKRQSKVGSGSTLSGSQTGAAATTTTASDLDGGFDSVKSASAKNLLAEAASSSGESPDLLSSSDALGHAFLFSSSHSASRAADVISDGVRSLATSLHHAQAAAGARRPRSWEHEHPALLPHDLQANRESPIFYLHSQGAHAPGFPSSHIPVVPPVDLAERSQRLPLGIVANPGSHLTLPTFFQHGDASPSTNSTAGMEMQSVRSRDPSHTSLPAAARYSHLNLVSESLALAPAYTDLGHPLRDLGPTATATAPAVAAVATAHTHSGVGPSDGPDLVAQQLGPSTAPMPSLYWLLFDMDCDSIDRTRDGDLSSLSPPKIPSGDDANANANAGMETATGAALPYASSVTPTPISFIAKWEDMLALERRIRSSSSSSCDNNNENAAANDLPPPQSSKKLPEAQSQAQAQTRPHAQDQAVEIKKLTGQTETIGSFLMCP